MKEYTALKERKTVTAFGVGLMVGGLLVWVFNDTQVTAPNVSDMPVATTEQQMALAGASNMSDETGTVAPVEAVSVAQKPDVGDGRIVVGEVNAGTVVELKSATFPANEGWVGVRRIHNGQVANILGAARYSQTQGLIPKRVELLTPMVAGVEYAVVFFTEDGDRQFNPRTDTQLDIAPITFTAR